MTTNYIYTASTTELKNLLNTIRKNPPPNNGVTDEYLVKIGAGTDRNDKVSTNAKAARNVIRAMGIVDYNNKPTNMWISARTNFEETMLEGLRNIYPDEDGLLDYSEINAADIRNWFKSATGLADATQKMCVSTFLTIQAAARGEDITPNQRKRIVKHSPSNTASRPNVSPQPDTNVSAIGEDYPPLIVGLMQELPKEGASWSEQEQNEWIDFAKTVFKRVYKNTEPASTQPLLYDHSQSTPEENKDY